MAAEPHPWLCAIGPAPHGGAAPAGMLDLSASIAPLGPSPRAVAAARAAPLDAYPAADAAPLVGAAARELGVAPERIVPGAGAADLLVRAMLAHLRPGDRVALVSPCFGEYARAAAASGAEPVAVRTASGAVADPAELTAVAAAVRTAGARVAVLARPANPTGEATPVAAVRELTEATPGTRWIVDEAFAGLAGEAAGCAGGEAVVLRSLTKELALPGLRVGVADAPPRVAGAMRALAPPWCVSGPAIAAAVAGLGDVEHRGATLEAVARGRAALLAAAASAEVPAWRATANYVCLRPPDAGLVERRLGEAGIAIRRCDDLGLPGAVRVAVPPPAALGRVVEALGAALRALARVNR